MPKVASFAKGQGEVRQDRQYGLPREHGPDGTLIHISVFQNCGIKINLCCSKTFCRILS
jgi:hypothetical protein